MAYHKSPQYSCSRTGDETAPHRPAPDGCRFSGILPILVEGEPRTYILKCEKKFEE